MKRLFLIIVILVLGMPISAVTLEGGITYTVESARKEAFDGVVYKIPTSIFSKHKTDPNFALNKEAMAHGIGELSDRWIEHFSSGRYGIVYKNDRYKELLYNMNGSLSEITIRSSLNLPAKGYSYNINGELESITFYVTFNDIYIYTVDGVLETHWVGDKAYDKNGKLKVKRYD